MVCACSKGSRRYTWLPRRTTSRSSEFFSRTTPEATCRLTYADLYMLCAIYAVSHKISQLVFVCSFVKNQRILMQFSLLYFIMNGTCDGVNFFTSPSQCCYTTLRKSKHWKCNITVGDYQRKLHQIYYSFIEVDQGHHVP